MKESKEKKNVKRKCKSEDPESLYILGKKYINIKENETFKLGLNLLIKSGNLNNVNACMLLGKLYDYGIRYSPALTYNDFKPDLNIALKWYRKAYKLGNIDALIKIGIMYKCNNDVPNAIKYYKKAASYVNLQAFFLLACIYQESESVGVNMKKVAYYYKLLANHDDPAGQHGLACMYWQGVHIRQNLTKAINLFEMAARNGLRDSAESLGYIYCESTKVNHEISKAIYWFEFAAKYPHKKASSRSNPIATDSLVTLVKLLLTNESKNNIKKAIYWLEKIIMRNNKQGIDDYMSDFELAFFQSKSVRHNISIDLSEALKCVNKEKYKLAILYCKGITLEINIDEAIRLYEGIAIGKLTPMSISANAAHNLGCIYQWIRKDNSKAIAWFEFADGKLSASSQLQLGDIYRKGIIVKKNLNLAFDYYKKSAEGGNAQGQHSFGIMFLNGYGTEADENEAINWLTIAAKQGNVNAQYSLGVTLNNPLSDNYDPIDSQFWINEAAKQNHNKAQYLLENIVSS